MLLYNEAEEGSVAYWMELRKVFDAVENTLSCADIAEFIFIDETISVPKNLQQLGFSLNDIFRNEFDLLNQLVKRESNSSWDISDEIKAISNLYKQLQAKASETLI
jgi:hypothetical protein